MVQFTTKVSVSLVVSLRIKFSITRHFALSNILKVSWENKEPKSFGLNFHLNVSRQKILGLSPPQTQKKEKAYKVEGRESINIPASLHGEKHHLTIRGTQRRKAKRKKTEQEKNKKKLVSFSDIHFQEGVKKRERNHYAISLLLLTLYHSHSSISMYLCMYVCKVQGQRQRGTV